MKSQIELYDVKLNKNSALAYVRDVKDEHVIEPVPLKRDFGETLATKLQDLRSDDNAQFGNVAKNVNGRLKGVVTQDSDGYGHVDWSTVNVDRMRPVQIEDDSYKKPEFINADLKRNSVYGDFATGNIRESKVGDAAIVKLDNMDSYDGVHVMADGRKALSEGSVLPVADEHLALGYDSTEALFGKLVENEFGQDFDYRPEFNQIAYKYMVGISSIDSGKMVVHEVNGSIVDVIDDIKDFAKDNDVSIDDFFKAQRDAESVEASALNKKYDEYVIETATDREVKPHYISNLTFDKKSASLSGYGLVEQQISDFDNIIVDDASVQKYATTMQSVGSGTDAKSPYDVRESLHKVEPKDSQEVYDKLHDDMEIEI